MLQRLLWTMRPIVLALIAAVAALADPGSARAQRIVAIGDLHGDFAAYHAIVRAAGLVDGRDRWTGGRAILVQTGDIADRGPDSLRIIRHLVRLQRQAARAGGRVVTLVGNHEAMNVTGDLRYVHPGEYAAFVDGESEARRERVWRTNRTEVVAHYRSRDPALDEATIREMWLRAVPLGWVEHRFAWSPRGELGRWTIGNPAVVLIDGTLFVHGGISAAYASRTLAEINRRTALALAARGAAADDILTDPEGPLWYRGLAAYEDNAAADVQPRLSIGEELDLVLRAYGARRIVIGHTPNLDGIVVLHEGRLARIDTGIAAAYGGRRTYLVIDGDRLVPHVVDDTTPSGASE